MKRSILLVNCYRERPEEKIRGYCDWLQAGAAAAGVEAVVIEAADREALPVAGAFAAAIVSGSQKMLSDGEAEAGLLDFLRRNRRPLLGICYGHQALARAWGGRVERGAAKHQGEETIVVRGARGLFRGFPREFRMVESHEEAVIRDRRLEGSFRVLAWSGGGLVEAIAHRERPLYGVQFHPEKSGEPGIRLLANFLNTIV